jgi:hypothetical protein
VHEPFDIILSSKVSLCGDDGDITGGACLLRLNLLVSIDIKVLLLLSGCCSMRTESSLVLR